MTPPERELVVCVCPNRKCEAVTVIPADELPEGWAGSLCYGTGKWHKPVIKVDYVPASQLEQVEKELDRAHQFIGVAATVLSSEQVEEVYATLRKQDA